MNSSDQLSDLTLVQGATGSSLCRTLPRQFLDVEAIDTTDWPSCEHLGPHVSVHQEVLLETANEISDALIQVWKKTLEDTVC